MGAALTRVNLDLLPLRSRSARGGIGAEPALRRLRAGCTAAEPMGCDFGCFKPPWKSGLALAAPGCSQGMVLGLLVEIHLSLFSKTPFQVGMEMGASPGSARAILAPWPWEVGWEWDTCEPQAHGMCRQEQRTTVQGGFTQPHASQDPSSWTGRADSRDGEVVGPGTCYGLREGGKVELSLRVHRTMGTLKTGVGREERSQPSTSWPCGAYPLGWEGSIRSCQPFVYLLLPAQCLAAGPFPPHGSSSRHFPLVLQSVLLAGGQDGCSGSTSLRL